MFVDAVVDAAVVDAAVVTFSECRASTRKKKTINYYLAAIALVNFTVQ